MSKSIQALTISLLFSVVLFSTTSSFSATASILKKNSAEQVNPSEPLSAEQRSQVEIFSRGYVTALGAIGVILGDSEGSRDTEVARLLELLKNCKPQEFADGGLKTIEGQNCKINFERITSEELVGEDAFGEEIILKKTTDNFVVFDNDLADLLGFNSWQTIQTVKAENLVSTPVKVLITNKHSRFLMTSGKVIEMSTHKRNYANLENYEKTNFSRHILTFEDFAVRYEAKTRYDEAGNSLSEEYVLNQKPTTLSELVALVTAELIE